MRIHDHPIISLRFGDDPHAGAFVCACLCACFYVRLCMLVWASVHLLSSAWVSYSGGRKSLGAVKHIAQVDRRIYEGVPPTHFK